MIIKNYLYSDRVTSPTNSWFQNLSIVLFGTLVLALSSQLSFPLPFTPICFCLAPQVAIMLGVVFGKKLGTLSVLTYILQGTLGLPVFALGHSGPAVLLGVSGGYLIGYLIAAYLGGIASEKSSNPVMKFSVLMSANLLILLSGSLFLTQFMDLKMAFTIGFLPFVIPDTLKLILLSKWIKR